MVRLCLMRCFFPDRLLQEIKSFISFFLGRNFTESPPFEFVHIYNQSDKKTPILLLLGNNVNCYNELFNNKMLIPQTQSLALDYQPLGQIEYAKIVRKIIFAACMGNWLLLDNLQMSVDIVPNLQAFIERMVTYSKKSKKKLETASFKELLKLLEH